MMLLCFALLPLVIVADNVAWFLIGDDIWWYTVVVELGFHAVNLQTALTIPFYFTGLLILIYHIVKKEKR